MIVGVKGRIGDAANATVDERIRMIIDRNVRRLGVIAAVWVAFATSGCANLSAIREFAATSSDAAQYSRLVSAYVEAPARQKRYAPAAAAADLDRRSTERKAQQERLLLRHKLVQEYMDTLGALAADELTGYDKDIDALGGAVRNAKLADPDEAKAFASVSKLLVTAATDRWRQRKLVSLIEEANAPFQTVMASLLTIVETGFTTDVSIERVALQRYYGTLERESKDPAGIAALAEWQQVREAQLADQDTAIRNYVVVLKTIAAGHQKLYDARHELSRVEVQAEIGRYTKRLKEAFNAIRHI
jgi:hypothetical protein